MVTVVLALLLTAEPDSAALSNADVIRLLQAKVPESVIIQMIGVSRQTFDVSPSGLVELVRAGAGERVLTAMIGATGGAATGSRLAMATETLPVEIRLTKGGEFDWGLWTRDVGGDGEVGVLFSVDTATSEEAIEQYNTSGGGVAVMDGSPDTYSMHALGCTKQLDEGCSGWDWVRLHGVMWSPPESVTIQVPLGRHRIRAVAVMRAPGGRVIPFRSRTWYRSDGGVWEGCQTKSTAVTEINVKPDVRANPLVLHAKMELAVSRAMTASSVGFCEVLSF
jgi:hypothetical protein